MRRFFLRWLPGTLLGIAIVVALAGSWLVATESGARWLVRRAAAYLPEALELGDVSGTLSDGLRFATLRWDDESVRVSVRDLYADVELRPLIRGRVHVLGLEAGAVEIVPAPGNSGSQGFSGLPAFSLPVDLAVDSATVRNLSMISGDKRFEAAEIGLAGSMEGADLDIYRFSLRSEQADLDLDGSAQFAAPHRANLVATWRFDAADGRRYAGRLQLRGDSTGYAVTHTLSSPVAVATSGTLTALPDEFSAQLENRWSGLEWPVGESTLRSQRGVLTVAGDTNAFSVSLDATAEWPGAPAADIVLEGEADPAGIRFSRLDVASDAGRLNASGTATWSPLPSVNADFRADSLDLSQLERWFPAQQLEGMLQAAGHGDWQLSDGNQAFDLRVDSAAGTLNGHSLTASGRIGYRDATLDVAAAKVDVGANSLAVSGRIADTVALKADLSFADLGQVPGGLSGSLEGHIDANGRRDNPDVELTLNGSKLAWRDYAAAVLSADGKVTSARDLSLHLKLEDARAAGREISTASLALEGRPEGHEVTATVSSPYLDADVAAGGAYRDGQWSGDIRSLAIQSEPLGRWASESASHLSAGTEQAEMSQICLQGPSADSRLCFEGKYAQAGPADFGFLLSGMPIAALPLPWPAGLSIDGTVEASAKGQFAAGRLAGEANVELRDAAVSADYEGETVSAKFDGAMARAGIVDNRLDSVVKLSLAGQDTHVDLSLGAADVLDAGSALDGHGEIRIADAGVFAIFVPDISSPAGSVDGSVDIHGSLREPQVVGEVRLADGRFGVRRTGITVSDVNASIRQLAPGRMQVEGRARSGEGNVVIRGETRIGTESGIRSEFTINGENFELARLPDWKVTASPSMSIVFDDKVTSLTGNLTVPTADITIHSLPETAVSPSPDARVHLEGGATVPTGRRIDVDINTAFGDKVNFAGFGLTSGIEGSVRIRGGSQTPYTGAGRLSLRGGRYEAYGQQLEIEHGEMIFSGRLDEPELDVRAVRKMTDVTAGIQLTGTPGNLRSEVFSDPALSDAEALSYLLTGRPLSSASQAGEGDTLNNAAFALGLSGAGTIASQIGTSLGLETLAVEGGADNGRIIAGKRFGSRLLVEYGYGLIDKLGTLLLRYQLTDRLMLESRTGTVSNLDILYTVKRR